MAIIAWPCVLRTALPCCGGNHLERGGLQLHDAVRINCEKGVTTEMSSIWAKECMLMIVLVI